MADHLTRLAFWLIPETGQRQELQECINNLAQQFMASRFVPHVTVYSCQRSPAQKALAFAKELAADTPCFSAEVECLTGEDFLTRALYLKLSHNNHIDRLYQTLHSKVPEPSPFKLRPHLSLLYQHIDATQRKRLCREINLAISRIRFAEFWVVAIPQQLKTDADLVGWQTLLRRRLATDEIAATI